MPIELVVFDVAGTTIADEGAVAQVFTDALGAAGVPVNRDDVDRVMGLPKPTAIRALLAPHRAGEPIDDEVRTIHAAFADAMLHHYRTSSSVRALPGAREALELLRHHGIAVALDTGFDRRLLDAVLERVGWKEGEVFDVSVASDEVERGRPHSDMIFEAMRRTGVLSTTRVAKVGDTVVDVLEGMNAGCGLVVGVTSGTATKSDLIGARASLVVDDVAAFAEYLLDGARWGSLGRRHLTEGLGNEPREARS